MTKSVYAFMLLAFVALANSEIATAKITATETAIASKRDGNQLIVITTKSGGLTAGENDICVTFRDVGGKESSVEEVAVDFSQVVGKIHEQPIRAQIIRQHPGVYCGVVDLGRLYYTPSTYLVSVRYLDEAEKERKLRLWATAR